MLSSAGAKMFTKKLGIITVCSNFNQFCFYKRKTYFSSNFLPKMNKIFRTSMVMKSEIYRPARVLQRRLQKISCERFSVADLSSWVDTHEDLHHLNSMSRFEMLAQTRLQSGATHLQATLKVIYLSLYRHHHLSEVLHLIFHHLPIMTHCVAMRKPLVKSNPLRFIYILIPFLVSRRHFAMIME